jgi:hypothetical protein
MFLILVSLRSRPNSRVLEETSEEAIDLFWQGVFLTDHVENHGAEFGQVGLELGYFLVDLDLTVSCKRYKHRPLST